MTAFATTAPSAIRDKPLLFLSPSSSLAPIPILFLHTRARLPFHFIFRPLITHRLFSSSSLPPPLPSPPIPRRSLVQRTNASRATGIRVLTSSFQYEERTNDAKSRDIECGERGGRERERERRRGRRRRGGGSDDEWIEAMVEEIGGGGRQR